MSFLQEMIRDKKRRKERGLRTYRLRERSALRHTRRDPPQCSCQGICPPLHGNRSQHPLYRQPGLEHRAHTPGKLRQPARTQRRERRTPPCLDRSVAFHHLATTAAITFFAPASFRARAHSAHVAAVVITSSTTSTRFPRKTCALLAANALVKFFRLSRGESAACGLACGTQG